MLKRIKNITLLIRNIIGDFNPEKAIVIGSGVGCFVDAIEVKHRISYCDIDGFPKSSVVGHKGEFVFGVLAGQSVVVMNGRVHHYEGYSMQDVVCGVRVMKMLGAKELYVTNAAGGINKKLALGDIMVISDHLNFIPNPLIGANEEGLGERFPAMTDCYSARLREAALASGVEFKTGVYAALTGPSYETAAEINYLRIIGADAVGMSTAPEVVAGHHMGMEVFGVSVITNLTFSNVPPTHNEVIEVGSLAAAKVVELLTALIKGVK